METLTELFSRDPLKLSEQDLDLIIAELRKRREQYNLGEKQAGSMKTKEAKPKPVPVNLAATLDL